MFVSTGLCRVMAQCTLAHVHKAQQKTCNMPMCAVLRHGYLPEEAQERLQEPIMVYQLTYTITHRGIAMKSGKSVVGNARAL